MVNVTINCFSFYISIRHSFLGYARTKCTRLSSLPAPTQQIKTNNVPPPATAPQQQQEEEAEEQKQQHETYGQPTPQTHPHLLLPNELVQGVCADEFVQRRQNVMESIQRFATAQDKALNNHLVVIPSATKMYMSDKIPYVFRQNSDFLYLTGCLELDTVLVMWIDGTTPTAKSALFARPKDKQAELWDGARTGVNNARQLFKVDQCYAFNELPKFLKK